jgi:serine/threonine protein kinase
VLIDDPDSVPEIAGLCIPFSLLELKEKIGAGSSGQVFRGTYFRQDVAVKQLFSQLMDECDFDDLLREARVQERLRHPGIIRFYGISIDPQKREAYIVTEYCESDALGLLRAATKVADASRQREEPPNTAEAPSSNGAPGSESRKHVADVAERQFECDVFERQLLSIALDVAETLYFLHAKNVVHRDLKPSNLLLVRAGEGDESGVAKRVKLCDFGISKMYASTSMRRRARISADLSAARARGTWTLRPRDSDSCLTVDGAGTPAYMAPELMHALPAEHQPTGEAARRAMAASVKDLKRALSASRGDSKKSKRENTQHGVEKERARASARRSDVYSFGMLLFALTARVMPFQGASTREIVERVVVRDERPAFPDDVDARAAGSKVLRTLRGVIEACWSREPLNRPTFAQVAQTLKLLAAEVDLDGHGRKAGGKASGLGTGGQGQGAEKRSLVEKTTATTRPAQRTRSTPPTKLSSQASMLIGAKFARLAARQRVRTREARGAAGRAEAAGSVGAARKS